MDKNSKLSGGLIAAFVALSVLGVMCIPGWFTPEAYQPMFSIAGYEAAWFLLKATVSPMLPVLPIVFVTGLFAASYFIRNSRSNWMTHFVFQSMAYTAQLPSAFFVFVIFALQLQGISLELEIALAVTYLLVLLPRFSVAVAVILRPLGKGTYATGIAFGASEFRTVTQLVWPSVLGPLVAHLLRSAAILSLEVTPAVLLSYAFPFAMEVKPASAELFLQADRLSSMSLLTFTLTILAFALLLYGISHALQQKSALKISGEYNAR